MRPRPQFAEKRGHATMLRLAEQIALEYGLPFEHAMENVRQVFRAIKEDLTSAQRFVIPAVLVIERARPGARKPHRVRFVLRRRQRDAEKQAAIRARRAHR